MHTLQVVLPTVLDLVFASYIPGVTACSKIRVPVAERLLGMVHATSSQWMVQVTSPEGGKGCGARRYADPARLCDAISDDVRMHQADFVAEDEASSRHLHGSNYPTIETYNYPTSVITKVSIQSHHQEDQLDRDIEWSAC